MNNLVSLFTRPWVFVIICLGVAGAGGGLYWSQMRHRSQPAGVNSPALTISEKRALALNNLRQQQAALTYWQGQVLQWQQAWNHEKSIIQQLQMEKSQEAERQAMRLSEMTAKLSALEATRQELVERLAFLTNRLNKSDAQNQSDRELIAHLTRQIDKLKRHNANLSQNETELNKKLSDLAAGGNETGALPLNPAANPAVIIQKYETKIAELTLRLERRDRARAEAEIQRSEIMAEHEQLISERDQLLTERGQNRIIIQQAQKQIELATAQIANLRKELSQTNRALVKSEARAIRDNKQKSAQFPDLGGDESKLRASLTGFRQKLLTDLYQKLTIPPAAPTNHHRTERDDSTILIYSERLIVPTQFWFKPGSRALTAFGKSQAKIIGDALKSSPRLPTPRSEYYIAIDVYGDAESLDAALDHENSPNDAALNAKLSHPAAAFHLTAARAAELASALLDHGVPPQMLRASGFGEFRPMVRGDAKLVKWVNRRVEFSIALP